MEGWGKGEFIVDGVWRGLVPACLLSCSIEIISTYRMWIYRVDTSVIVCAEICDRGCGGRLDVIVGSVDILTASIVTYTYNRRERCQLSKRPRLRHQFLRLHQKYLGPLDNTIYRL